MNDFCELQHFDKGTTAPVRHSPATASASKDRAPSEWILRDEEHIHAPVDEDDHHYHSDSSGIADTEYRRIHPHRHIAGTSGSADHGLMNGAVTSGILLNNSHHHDADESGEEDGW